MGSIKEKKNNKTGIAISGGVDSAISAVLLKEQGYNLFGFFMRLPVANLTRQERKVKELANKLDIPLAVIDLRNEFSRLVIDYFVTEYKAGLTPNPCAVCNHLIKFGLLRDAILSAGMDMIATGHYARVAGKGDSLKLLKGIDEKKDQSYFFARLRRQQLEKVIFPLGSLQKDDVIRRAERLNILPEPGKESQDVCFLSGTLRDFLKAQGLPCQTGDVCTRNGLVVGKHKGLYHYTIGQRRGLGLPDATPWYVVGFDLTKNRLLVGKQDELWQNEIVISDLNWLANNIYEYPWQGQVKLRSTHKEVAATLEQIGDNRWLVRCPSPQRAITPGQFAVFYAGERMMGSGVIVAENYGRQKA